MNLKSAARVLGVHYQTAYRWVRSGELAAARSDDGYEISDEAIGLFTARREARRRLGQITAGDGMRPDAPLSTAAADVHDLVGECQELIRAGADSPMPALTHLLQGTALSFDALAVLHVLDEADPPDVAERSWWHPDPERNALWTRVLSRPDVTPVSCLAPALQARQLVSVDHLSAEQTQSFIPPDLEYLLDTIYPHSVLMVPLDGPERPVGVLSLIVDRPGRVFTDGERDAARQLAEVAAAAIVRARQFDRAERLRRGLHARLTELLADIPDRAAAVEAVRDAVTNAPGPAFVMTPEVEFVGASRAFEQMSGLRMASHAGTAVAAHSLAQDRPIDQAIVDRVVSGELDHFCIQRTRLSAHGPIEIDGHGSIVRWPDQTPAFVVVTQSRVLLSPRDWGGVIA